MQFFNSLPTTENIDSNGNYYVLKNLIIRTKLIPTLAQNPLLFYKYSIQDGDTPESIAYKYYGDQYRYWIVLIANEILDPQWQWPLNSRQFPEYINSKYKTEAQNAGLSVSEWAKNTIHHYEKVITTVDDTTQTTAIKTIEIDGPTYYNLDLEEKIKSFPDGSTVRREVNRRAVSYYDYEYEKNEAKREIKIINSKYVTEMETYYHQLVNS